MKEIRKNKGYTREKERGGWSRVAIAVLSQCVAVRGNDNEEKERAV